ncbi:glucose-1-phosphate thymidylyltransferase [Nocardia transvalensis]|uniref:glucose-1-phosphate thymidylyltransferase n=1 Tax=Nocardia transvalensis TaxID=37333 RepID=UPI00189479BB|nr:glucose-1-phosphate thymidylyltransferase [Nocardia transvalensis]MBF6328267.1 glucose-1-phosphate thymidylyltransferase [Nocardia transvalensis]
MKALILSGGTGTRLRPFTHSNPKQLLPVANKPVLEHCIEAVSRIGVSEIGIIVGDRLDQIAPVIEARDHPNAHITYIEQSKPLGLAHCVSIARDFLGDDDFVMYLGDNILGDGIADAAAAFRARKPDAHIMVAAVDDPRSYGVAEVEPDGRVLRLVEKPADPRSNLAIIGVYFFSAAVHDAVREITPSARGELEITDAIQHMSSAGRLVVAQEYAGYWKDTGKPEDLLECNRVMLERLDTSIAGEIDADTVVHGSVVIEAGAKVTRSVLAGPLAIAAGSVISDSTIGPGSAIGRDCLIEGSSIRNTIVLDAASINQVSGLHNSIIGRHADISGVSGPAPFRLFVGDHSYAAVGR